jgi:hypothetical protein
MAEVMAEVMAIDGLVPRRARHPGRLWSMGSWRPALRPFRHVHKTQSQNVSSDADFCGR